MIRAEQFSRLVQLREKQWPRFIILALIGFVVHLPSLQGQLVWDDSFLVRDNPFIKSPLFIFEAFRHYLFLDFYSAHYRPVQNLSFIADYFVWNGNLYGFHLTNLLLHIASGLLLYLLLGKLFSSLRGVEADNGNSSARSLGAFFVALLWIVHPVHSAAVDYISGRADSLAFFFACAGWLLFIRARKSILLAARTALYSFAALSGLLALCSREIAFVWILLFLLHLTFFEKGLSRRAFFITVLCNIGLLGIYAGLRTLPEVLVSTTPSQGWPASMRAVLMLRSLGDYARLMVFPVNLHMERSVLAPENYLSHDQWRHSAGVEYLSILGLAFLGALIYGAFRAGPSRGLRIFGASWFLLGYLPISNLIELNATVAEHWLYLPSVGFLIFAIGCVLDLPVRYRGVLAGCACSAVVALGVSSTIRSSDWLTDDIFYRRTLAAGGRSSRVLANLGQACANRGEYAKAEAILRNVLRLSADYPIARRNLAEVLLREGHKKEAEELLTSTTKAAERTRKEYPLTWVAVLSLALSHHREKDDTKALAIAEKARHDYPGVWEIIRFESEVLRQTRGANAAIPLVDAFAHDNWWHYGAAIALGRLYAEKGDLPRAEAALRHASWLDVHDAEALSLIAAISLRQNRFEEAYRAQCRAVARQPDQPRQYVLLSNILEKMGRIGEARDALAEVARLKALGRDAPAFAN